MTFLGSQIGGLTAVARHGTGFAATGRQTFRDSFREGHGCAVCPRIDIPSDVPHEERERRANALYRGHFARMRQART